MNLQSIFRRKEGEEAELGAAAGLLTSEALLNAIQLVKEGMVYDLGLERFHGMPLPAMHPPLEIMTYRSTQGMLNQGDQKWLEGEANLAGFGFTSEVVITCLHTGTHIDTFAHANAGPDHAWHGGYSANRYVGDFGALKSDASTLPPILCRGVLLDVASTLGVTTLDKGQGITPEMLEETCRRQNVDIRDGDVVLIRTGYLSQWPDKENLSAHAGSGIVLEAAQWLAEKNVLAVGADTEALEQLPSADPHNPHPVHTYLLVKKGIYMIELVDLEALSKDKRYEFLFVALPVKFQGGTAGIVDPVAVV